MLQVSDLFPGADVVASDAMDDFVVDVLPHKASLPLLTEEIGDTWIMGTLQDALPFSHPALHPASLCNPIAHSLHTPRLDTLFCSRAGPVGPLNTVLCGRHPTGASADPKKVALFRAASRVHASCFADHSCVERADNNTGVRFFVDIGFPPCLPRSLLPTLPKPQRAIGLHCTDQHFVLIGALPVVLCQNWGFRRCGTLSGC